MDKILSKDTIKNVFSALGAKTSDSNYGVALLDKTSGEPKGFMGMSDLASVLGGVMVIGSDEFIDANDVRLRQVGFHIFGVNTQTGGTEYNYPPTSADNTGSVAQCTLVSIFTTGSYGHQIFHRRKSINFFIRTYENDAWESWTKIPGVDI